ncbi:BamA/TamA family outer membrane protein [Hymenobacter sp. HMF4947]|uniref:BamA/TamA family outer membrane protein n=1 Tax=Hymenobacter ginkgonis TaxID=2682976 RepID=A0A7K1TEQ8_9BACT|nr:BamA/TamA family outer membrane protein [Hymenobacter ginkgonis]MVN76888.1 BamA/TamA family outer membrane protein [Hymenobacter ginkgonis]
MRFFPLALVASLGLAQAAQAQTLALAPSDSVGVSSARQPVAGPPPIGLSRTMLAKSQASGPNKITILPIPVLFYQDETGLGYGLGGLLSGRLGQDTATRASNARVQYWTTQKSQSLLQFVHTIYSPDEKFYLNGEISYYDNLLYYYGIGNNTLKANESAVANKLFIVNQRIEKRIAPKMFAGVLYRFTRTSQIQPDNNTTDGSKPNYFFDSDNGRLDQRQREATSISGVGPVFTLDTRDVALAAFHGDLLDISATFNGKYLGSDYNFVRYQIDARHFQPIFSTKTILALQFLGQFHSGNVPWRELAGLGANLGGTLYNNANLMRGVYEQRYRDRQMAVFQAELRQKLFWRIDGAAFGSVGQVGNNFSDYSFNGIKAAGGLGARFNFIRRDRVNLRLDYAWGPDGSTGLYFAIGEAF